MRLGQLGRAMGRAMAQFHTAGQREPSRADRRAGQHRPSEMPHATPRRR